MADLESKAHPTHEEEHDAVFDEKASVKDYKTDAIEAENAEHDMTVMQAIKAYPMASFWAFVMSCTIVSCSLQLENNVCCKANNCRSWNLTMSF